jgi:DNA-binding MarR family transcriptional regulator
MAPDAGPTDGVDEHSRSVAETWPDIDPLVEAIVSRIGKIDQLVDKAAAAALARVDLTHEEFKVLLNLHDGLRSHGWLCREQMTSTGAMTNRLDKLEHGGLVRRVRDPDDRRGVLLELTAAGREKLDDYIERAGARERELLGVLSAGEQKELNRLLRKLLISLQAELGPPPKRVSSAA